MKKLFITGGSGLLGSNIVKMAKPEFEIYATYYQNRVEAKGVTYFQIDISSAEELAKIEEIKPDYIIHCAALTDIDYCQRYADHAYRHNVIASINIAETAKRLKSRLLHISTDSLFDGKRGNYTEEDIPNPINIYARTKLEAEINVLSIYPDACVIRTNIYGWNMRNKFSLTEWMINTLRKGDNLPGLKDVYFTPILVNDLIGILFKIQESRYKGVLNVAGSQACNKLDFAYMIANIFDLDKSLIFASELERIKLFARRPKHTTLCIAKCSKLFNVELPGIEQGLEKMRLLEDSGYPKELKDGI